jgi:DNA polymerase-3 subunit gamma/tau
VALALYRKYRPATFADVVGQEHVTEPLRTALSAGRVNHAYLFSGPRGCGKTSSARILARSLNCEQGPTADPCGVCGSCVALAPEGPGNIDVIELDAASHGGVDDARELRDRAFYAPAESRYRVFIVDEAHMVTTQGFNALLKIVEEPPEHLVFVFATTEPEKVLSTIRSRTHHYPFRLIPPGTLRTLLERICADEGALVAPPVFPLVIRAGGGSARDTLSIMDQLLAGAGPEGVTYERAMALLGVTDVGLIDDTVDALAARDGAAVFETVDRLVEAGHDPRRFAADLLDRLRDLTLLNAVPDAAARGLVDAPGDELERMIDQATRLGAATLSRYAEIVHTGLTDMRGATAPRLLLELLCGRMLLPAASTDDLALLQRLERIERRADIAPAPLAGAESGEAGAAARNFQRPSRAAESAPTVAGSVAGSVAGPAAGPAPNSDGQARAERQGEAPVDRLPPPPPTRASTSAASTGGEAGTAAPTPNGAGEGGSAGRGAGSAGAGEGRSAGRAAGKAGAAEGRSAGRGAGSAGAGEGRSAERGAGEGGSAGRGAGSTGAGEVRSAERGAGSNGAGRAPDRSAAARPAERAAEPDRRASPPANRPPVAAQPAAGADDQRPAGAGMDAAAVRRAWPGVLERAKRASRSTEALLMHATVKAIEGDTLVLAITAASLARRLSEQRNTEVLSAALHAELGVAWRIRCEHDAGPAAGGGRPSGGAPSRPAAAPASSRSDSFQQRARQAAPRPAPNDLPPPPEPPMEEEEEEYFAQTAADQGEPASRRDPEEVAIELLSAELGARAVDEPRR